jgi:hypothetical protein
VVHECGKSIDSGEFSSKEEVDERSEGSYYDYVRRG